MASRDARARACSRTRTRTAVARTLLSLVLFALLVGPAFGDVIHLRSGGNIEGEVTGEEDGHLLVRTRFGVQRIARADVVRIEEKQTVREQYEKRLRALDREDADAVLELALWCKKKRMTAQYRELLELAVTADPEHEAAQTERGRVRFEGSWITPEERDEILSKREDAARRAEGLVQVDGEWVPREEAEARRKGLVFFRGRWVTQEDVYRAKGFVQDEQGEWVHRDTLQARKEVAELEEKLGIRLALRDTDHFSVRSSLGDEHVDELARDLEAAHQLFHGTFGLSGDLLSGRLLPVIEVKGRRKFQRFLDVFAEGHAMPKGWLEVAQQATGTYHFDPPMIADYLGTRTPEKLTNAAINKLGRILANRLYPNFNYLPPWYEEGIAVWLEVKIRGICTTYYLGAPGVTSRNRYQKHRPDTKDRFDPNKGWILHGEWMARLKDAVETGKDTPLHELLRREAAQFESLEIAKCFSVVEYLIDRDPAKFGRFVKELRSRLPRYEISMTPRERVDVHRRAFEEIYDQRVIELEEAWKSDGLGVRVRR